MSQAEAAQGQAVDLREYLAVLRARKWTILLVAALVIGSALFFSYQQTPRYTAESRVLVAALATNPGDLYAPIPTLETEIEVLRSEPVADLVREDLGTTQTPQGLLGGLTATIVTDSDVIIVAYNATDPTFARDASTSFAQNYLGYRRQQALEALLASQQAIEERLEFVQTQMSDLDEEIADARAAGESQEARVLQTQRTALVARLGVLQQQLSDVQPDATVRRGGGQVIQPASVPTSPSSPDHIRNGLLAAFLGLALGIGLAFLRERLDDRFRGRADVERALEAPVVATIPKFKAHKDPRRRVVVLTDPKGSSTEAYRSLRTNLQFILMQRNIKSLLITSASAGEGKTVTATNLGVALAQAGQKVLLISADLRKPTLEKYFGLERGEGLSTLLMDPNANSWNLIRDTNVQNLRLLPSGGIPHNPAELLTSARMGELIKEFEAIFDVILFDAPPVLPVADASVLGSHLGGAIIVVDAGETNRTAVVHAREELERVGTSILGSVLNAFDPSSSPYYYYEPYYRYYYAEAGTTTGNGGKGAPRKRGLFRSRR